MRGEKLAFIATEMDVALAMAREARDDFVARAIARHVVVRAKDFITLGHEFLALSRRAGQSTARVRAKLKAYEAGFDEYFATTRTKLGAHVQDLAFNHRIELWTDMEVTKLDYFVDGAFEICSAAASFGVPPVPGRRAIRAPAVRPVDEKVRIGTDVLAATRPNTMVMLNMTPVHQRAGELLAIAKWLHAEWRELRARSGDGDAQRVLKARIVTDIVSFADCLVTRADGGDVHVIGLEDLVREAGAGGDATFIERFRTTYRFDDRLAEVRKVRNMVGAHLDRLAELDDLRQMLDGVDLPLLGAFANSMYAVFQGTCRRTHFLEFYVVKNLAEDDAVVGAFGLEEPFARVQSFDGSARVQNGRRPMERFADETTSTMLRRWFAADGEDAEEIRHWFFSALRADGGVQLNDDPEKYPLSEAHTVLLDALTNVTSSAHEIERTLQLIEGCARGFPEPLAIVLVRAHRVARRRLPHRALVRTIGSLPLRGGEWARGPIREALGDPDLLLAAEAHIALYRSLSCEREGGPDEGATLFQSAIESSVASRPAAESVFLLLILGNAIAANMVWLEDREDEYQAVLRSLQDYAFKLVPECHQTLWSSLVRSGDFVGLSALSAHVFEEAGNPRLAALLVSACIEALIVPSRALGVASHSLTNLAYLFLDANLWGRAINVAKHVIATDPISVELHLRILPLLVQAGVPRDQVSKMWQYIADNYSLTPELTNLLAEARRAVDSAKPRPAVWMNESEERNPPNVPLKTPQEVPSKERPSRVALEPDAARPEAMSYPGVDGASA